MFVDDNLNFKNNKILSEGLSFDDLIEWSIV